MSRSRTRRTTTWTTYTPAEEYTPAIGDVLWTDPMGDRYPGYEWHQWQEAFAATTLEVTEHVWRRCGSKLYAPHRDKLLRDDLHSWLLVEAQRIANKYIPAVWADDPERRWAAFLRKVLTEAATWHFQHTVGSIEKHTRAEAVRIHMSGGLVSTDFLDELEDMTGARVDRRALHGHDPLTLDPEHVLIHLEELDRENADIERYLREHGTYGTRTRYATGTPCLVNLCTKPATARGMCRQHYMAERELRLEPGCNVPGCEGAHRARGLCNQHLAQSAAGTLPPEYERYIETQPRRRGYAAKQAS